MNKKMTFIAAAAVALASGFASANDLSIGEELPSVAIQEGGYSVIVDGEVEFNAWNTNAVKNGIIVAQAARPSVSELITDDFRQKMVAATHNNTYTIVNSDDAPFGVGMFIVGALKDGKIANPEGHSVMDEDGKAFELWGLDEESLAIIVLKDNKVTYIHEGLVTTEVESKILELVK